MSENASFSVLHYVGALTPTAACMRGKGIYDMIVNGFEGE